jgi:hypothetical protein
MALAVRSSTARLARPAARPAKVSRNMRVYAYKVTLKTPSGEQTIECPEDTYILVRAMAIIAAAHRARPWLRVQCRPRNWTNL